MALPPEIDSCYETAILCVKGISTTIRNNVRKPDFSTKSTIYDIVTPTDKQVEEHLIVNLKHKFPTHSYIGEEHLAASSSKIKLDDSPTWIIDPISGTTNLVHGYPVMAISVGLIYKKEVILGIVYNVNSDKLYTAIKGRGAFCNGKNIKVSTKKNLRNALVLFELGADRTPEVIDNVIANYKSIAPVAEGIRSLGSAAVAMCFVASGIADCFYDNASHCWEIAASKIIVEEAGGVVIDPSGEQLALLSRRVLCCSTAELAKNVSNRMAHMELASD